MARGNSRYKDLLDYTVTYKAVWTSLGVVVALAVAGWFAYQRFRPPSLSERARQAVKEASRLATRSDGCTSESTPGDLLATLNDAQGRLRQAETLLEGGRFEEAHQLAGEARELFRTFNDAVCAAFSSVATITDYQGDVHVKKVKSPRWVPASPSTRLLPGDRVWVESGIARIRMRNGETNVLRKGTVIEIEAFQPRADGLGRAELRFEHGDIFYEGKGAGSQIHTPFGVARPRTGDIALRRSEGSSELEVSSRKGGSEFSSGDERRQLDPITRVVARNPRDGRATLSDVERNLTGPVLRTPMNNRHFTVEKPSDHLTVFEWTKVEEAKNYLFHFARTSYFDPILNEGHAVVPQGRVEVAEEAEIEGLPPGTYYWRVAAVDGDGRAGLWSEERQFTIAEGSSSQEQREPPNLVIERQTQFGDKVIIQGHTDPYVRLECYVNDRRLPDVPLNEGSFSYMVELENEGENVVRLEAQDAYGTTTSSEITVYWSGI